MKHRTLYRFTAIAALTVPVMAGVAACGSGSRPPPVQATESTSPGSATPSPVAPADPVPSTCLGAVVYPFNAATSGAWPTPCITVGGVLRVENLGPGPEDKLSIEPAANVSCDYEAGIHQCRLLTAGALKVAITRLGQTRVLNVIVAEAVTPPRPAPACQSGGTYTVDASDGGPPWWAICLKTDVVLRVTNHGPDGFTVTPADHVSCNYEAGVRVCRFLKAGTVTLTVTRPNETRPLTIVVIR
jgi:hypothetical protein